MTTTATYREPSDLIRSWDPFAAETACVAQLLYMYSRWDLPQASGFVSAADMSALDARVGRSPGGIDLVSGGARVLFEEGFHAVAVSRNDIRRLATDADYLRQQLLSQDLETPEHLDEVLPAWTPIVQSRMASLAALQEQYSAQLERVEAAASWDLIGQLVDDGHHVAFSTVNDDGTTLACLAISRPARSGGDTLHVFIPTIGLGNTGPIDRLANGVTGWRLP